MDWAAGSGHLSTVELLRAAVRIHMESWANLSRHGLSISEVWGMRSKRPVGLGYCCEF